MDPDQRQFLSLIVLPARLSQQEAAWYLGFQLHDISGLVNAGMLHPLGHPKPNSIKYFALADLERLRADVKRLSRGTDAVQVGWQRKNNRGAKRPTDGCQGKIARLSRGACQHGNEDQLNTDVQPPSR